MNIQQLYIEQLLSPVAIVTLLSSVVAAFTDVVRFKVYNVLTLPLIASGVVYHAMVDGVDGVGVSIAGMFAGLAVLTLPFLMGGMGAGDLKLLAGVGAWVGVPCIIYVFVIAGLLSGAFAIAMLLWEKRSFSAVLIEFLLLGYRMQSLKQDISSGDWAEQPIATRENKHRVIPFAVMIAVGVVFTLLFVPFEKLTGY